MGKIIQKHQSFGSETQFPLKHVTGASSLALGREDCEKTNIDETSWADQRNHRYSSKNMHHQAIPGAGIGVLSEQSGRWFSSHLVHV